MQVTATPEQALLLTPHRLHRAPSELLGLCLPAADCHARAGPQRGPLHKQNILQDGLPHGQQLQGGGSAGGTWPRSVPGCLGVWQALGAGFPSEHLPLILLGPAGAEALAADVGVLCVKGSCVPGRGFGQSASIATMPASVGRGEGTSVNCIVGCFDKGTMCLSVVGPCYHGATAASA